MAGKYSEFYQPFFYPVTVHLQKNAYHNETDGSICPKKDVYY